MPATSSVFNHAKPELKSKSMLISRKIDSKFFFFLRCIIEEIQRTAFAKIIKCVSGCLLHLWLKNCILLNNNVNNEAHFEINTYIL